MHLARFRVPQNVTRTIGRQILITKKNSPHIFFAAGILGITGSTVLACKATLKLEPILDEIEKNTEKIKNDTEVVTDQKQRDSLVAACYIKGAVKIGKLYGPSIVLGAASVAALTGSHVQMTRRNAALTATLTLVSKAYDDYRTRVREELGEKKELDLYRGIVEKEETVDGKKQISRIGDPTKHSPYARFFDEMSINWERNAEINRIFVQCQQSYMNQLLHARGHVFLNEVYDALGLERSQAGAVVGWVREGNGDGYIDFGIFVPDNARFVNNMERSVLLDFNVDGVIYDKI
jgi:Family of unknown function (DUF6353)